MGCALVVDCQIIIFCGVVDGCVGDNMAIYHVMPSNHMLYNPGPSSTENAAANIGDGTPPSSSVHRELGLGFSQQRRRTSTRDSRRCIVRCCHVGLLAVNTHCPDNKQKYHP